MGGDLSCCCCCLLFLFVHYILVHQVEDLYDTVLFIYLFNCREYRDHNIIALANT